MGNLPQYANPLLNAHAVPKHRRPSGHFCHQCGRSHEKGNCPAYRLKCPKCVGSNHFKEVCIMTRVTEQSRQDHQWRVKRCHVLCPKDRWIDCFITDAHNTGRSYDIQVEAMDAILMWNQTCCVRLVCCQRQSHQEEHNPIYRN